MFSWQLIIQLLILINKAKKKLTTKAHSKTAKDWIKTTIKTENIKMYNLPMHLLLDSQLKKCFGRFVYIILDFFNVKRKWKVYVPVGKILGCCISNANVMGQNIQTKKILFTTFACRSESYQLYSHIQFKSSTVQIGMQCQCVLCATAIKTLNSK